MAGKNKNRIIIMITASVVALTIVAVLVVAKVPQIRLALAPSGIVTDGILTDVGDAKHIDNVPSGEILYLINKNVYFKDRYALGKFMFENPESCKYTLEFSVYDQNGILIYVSPHIAPGQCLEEDKLSAVVDPGEYQCSYSAKAYLNNSLSGEVTGAITISVGK